MIIMNYTRHNIHTETAPMVERVVFDSHAIVRLKVGNSEVVLSFPDNDTADEFIANISTCQARQAI